MVLARASVVIQISRNYSFPLSVASVKCGVWERGEVHHFVVQVPLLPCCCPKEAASVRHRLIYIIRASSAK